MYDLIIKNANVLDGTGADAFLSDVAIKDGKIAKIGKELSGADKIIDATGLTLSPGWIDSHSHSDRSIVTFPDQREKIEQGITFSITGQCGGSVAPKLHSDGSFETMGEFLKKAQGIPQGSSSKVLVGFNTLRKAVMGTENRLATKDELEQMKELLREAMRGGALGVSYGLIYVPGCYASTEEVVEIAKVVKEFDGILASHIRNEGADLIEAVEEFLIAIRESGCRAVFSHHKSASKANWGKVKKSLALIDKAIEEGYDIYADVYPYCASHTGLSTTFIPKKFHYEGLKSPLSLLDSPEVCEKIKEYMDNIYNGDYSWTVIASCPAFKEYEGLTLQRIAEIRNEHPIDAVHNIIRANNGGGGGCYFTMCEEDVEYVIKHPRVMICTDSGVKGNATYCHPRLRASFPRALGVYARERGVISIPEMIRRMTSLPAHVYKLDTKGIIAEGMDADICIFDADKLIDRANYKDCFLKNEGLDYVILDGKVVVEDGVYNGIRAGKVVLQKI